MPDLAPSGPAAPDRSERPSDRDGAGSIEADDAGRDLQHMLLDASGLENFLGEVAQRAAQTVIGSLACGVTVRAAPSARMIGATSDDFARRMDEIQYDVDDGPCLTCLRDGEIVTVEDIANDRRWPAFSERGRIEGAGSSLSVPMRLRGRPIGALNLYSAEPHALDDGDRARARRFADQAAGAVALAIRLDDGEERSRHLEVALQSRSVIDQALGILMGQRRITSEEAFDVLRRLSQRANVKLRDVAAALIADVTGEATSDPDAGPPVPG